MREALRLGVAGAGLIGRRHAAVVKASATTVLAGIADPAEAARDAAREMDVPWHPSLEAMLDRGGIDGVILATPNRLHVDGGLACVAAGVPVLVEKPLATEAAGARRLVETAEAAGVPLAVGHHRRHNPLIVKARELVVGGALGRVVSVHGMTWLIKPDEYFEVGWRRRKGAGPVYINLAHDVDLLMHFCGPIEEVVARESNAVRGNEVEDTAVILLRFASGALGTVNVSDTAAAPWSWELTARENPAYPATGQDCYWIAGTEGALSLPNLALWTHPGGRSWYEPISATKMPVELADPLALQVEQFAAVIRDGVPPLVSGRDGLATLEVIEAVKASAASGRGVRPGG